MAVVAGKQMKIHIAEKNILTLPGKSIREWNANTTGFGYWQYGETPARSHRHMKDDHFGLRLWLTVTSTVSLPALFTSVGYGGTQQLILGTFHNQFLLKRQYKTSI